MTTMLGFCCCAVAGAAPANMAAHNADKLSQIVLIELMVFSY